MTTRAIDIHELKAIHSRRFEEEHMEFLANGLYPEWWDCIEADFKREMTEIDVTVERITFEGLDYGHPDANWSGTVDLAAFMKRTKVKDSDDTLAERYPALFLAVEYDRSWITVALGGRRDNQMVVDFHEGTYGTYPMGIFSALPEEAWGELILDSWDEADLQSYAEKFVQEKANDLLKRLQAEWDYISSEEFFIERCEINEITFEIEEETV